ncbi:MAG: SH3 domain-containing protein [Butyrivibrio sp.]|nr:SH3 domain-containing protein [Butyrivibrio sp.]
MRKTFGQRIGSVLLSLAVAAIIFIGSGFVAFAAQTGTVIKDDVKVRESASTTSAQVSSLKKGDTVDILEESNDDSGYVWYKIKVKNNEYGYVRSDLVEKGGSSSSGGGGNNTTSVSSGTATIIPDSATIRQGAGKDYDSVGKATKGESVTIVGKEDGSDGKTWYKITYGDGKEGYIRSDLVSESGGGDASESLEEIVDISGDTGESEENTDDSSEVFPEEESYDDTEEAPQEPAVEGDGKYKLEYDSNDELWYLAFQMNDKGVRVKVDQLVEAGLDYTNLSEKLKTYKTIIYALGGLAGLLLVVIIVLVIKLRDASYYEDEEDEDDDEEDDYSYSKKRSKNKDEDSGSKSRRRAKDDDDDDDGDSRVVSPKRTISDEGDPIARRPSAADVYTPTKRPSASDMYESPRRTSADIMDSISRRPSADDSRMARPSAPERSVRPSVDDSRMARSSRPAERPTRRKPESDFTTDRYSSRGTEERSARPSARRDEGYSFEDIDDSPRRRAKNFLGDDDDFEFEFLDLDDDK